MSSLKYAKQKLNKFYNKQLKRIHKENFGKTNNLEYFVTYLQYMRDLSILSKPLEIDGEPNIQVNSLIATINAYYEYKNCILKYYHVTSNGTLEPNRTDQTKAEVLTAYSKERGLHWQHFWQLVYLNIEDWMVSGVTV